MSLEQTGENGGVWNVGEQDGYNYLQIVLARNMFPNVNASEALSRWATSGFAAAFADWVSTRRGTPLVTSAEIEGILKAIRVQMASSNTSSEDL